MALLERSTLVTQMGRFPGPIGSAFPSFEPVSLAPPLLTGSPAISPSFPDKSSAASTPSSSIVDPRQIRTFIETKGASAKDLIETLAEQYRVILFGEADHGSKPKNELLPDVFVALKAKGYEYLLIELETKYQGLIDRGEFQTISDKFWLNPSFGEVVRSAVNAGLKVVAADEQVEGQGFQRAQEASNSSFVETLENILRNDPRTKVAVLIGAGHIGKSDRGSIYEMLTETESGLNVTSVVFDHKNSSLTLNGKVSQPTGLMIEGPLEDVEQDNVLHMPYKLISDCIVVFPLTDAGLEEVGGWIQGSGIWSKPIESVQLDELKNKGRTVAEVRGVPSLIRLTTVTQGMLPSAEISRGRQVMAQSDLLPDQTVKALTSQFGAVQALPRSLSPEAVAGLVSRLKDLDTQDPKAMLLVDPETAEQIKTVLAEVDPGWEVPVLIVGVPRGLLGATDSEVVLACLLNLLAQVGQIPGRQIERLEATLTLEAKHQTLFLSTGA